VLLESLCTSIAYSRAWRWCSFWCSFSRQMPALVKGKSGADARFPSKSRHVVGFLCAREPNGVQGVAGSNPAVPIGQMKARQQDTVVGLFFVAPDRAKGSTEVARELDSPRTWE
jgi:hypothetical protein